MSVFTFVLILTISNYQSFKIPGIKYASYKFMNAKAE